MKYKICLIEDDEILGEALLERLELAGFFCQWFTRGDEASNALKQQSFNAVVSDIQLPDVTGETLFLGLLEKGYDIPPFLFMTGYGTVDQAVRLLKHGAEDYLTKPFEVPKLITMLESLCQRHQPDNSEIIPLGVSKEMKAVEAIIPQIASSHSNTLITGASGTGKEYVALALHKASQLGTNNSFVAVNCGAIPEALFESELFGHTKGSFTGAIRNKRGFFEQAHNGTLFLDEIGEMPLSMQVKLLRAIQDSQVTRIGSEQSIKVNVRIICATNRDLEQMITENTFREDLYYRINVVNIHIPPLCQRTDDILWHAQLFFDEYAKQQSQRPITLHPRAEQALLVYPWPGNIRELRNTLERACVINHSSILTPESLFGDTWKLVLSRISKQRSENLSSYIQLCECDYIRKALTENKWRITDTAKALGISRKTLWDKMRKLGLNESK